MTSSNVSNILIQVNQIDVSTQSVDKSITSKSNNLFENTLKNVADINNKVDVKPYSTETGKQADSKRGNIDTTSPRRDIKENLPEDGKDQLVEKIEEIAEEIQDVIKEEFDVTDEDITLAMENLGLTVVDLLDPQMLAELVTEITGELDSIALVMNDEFANVLDVATNLTNQLFEETNASFAEIKELFTQAMAEVEGPEQEIQVEVIDEQEIDVVPMADKKTEKTVETNVENISNVVSENGENENPVTKEKAPQDKIIVESDETVIEVKGKETTDSNQKEAFSNGQENGDKTLNRDNPLVQEESKFSNQFVTPMDQTAQLQFTPAQEVILPSGESIPASNIAEQLIEHARVMNTSEATTMEMTLNPEGLGKIFIEVTQKGDEIIAKIFTENDAVKHALESQMATLRTDMNQNSSKVTSIEVSVGTHEFERNLEENGDRGSRQDGNNNEQASGRRGRIDLNSLENMGDIFSDEEVLIAQMMMDNGNSLDFMA